MKKIFFLIIPVCIGFAASAQQGLSKISVQHSTHLPLGSIRESIDQTTLRGFTADYSYFVTNQFSIGLTGGFNDLYAKKDRKTYALNDVDISAVKSYSIQTIPIMLKGNYNKIKEGSVLQPYVGLAVGASLVNYQEWYGTLVDEKNGLRFSVAPEIGTRIAFNKYSLAGADLSLRYHYTAFQHNDVKNLQTVSLNVGLFFFNRN